MMPIADTSIFQLGSFTVQQRPRPDNAGWPVYIVFLGDRLIGKSFSRPDLDCCLWLERQRRDELVYAEQSARLLQHTKIRGAALINVRRRVGRPTNAERLARDAYLAQIPEEVT
jgi:hypothetical protein